ncbi:MAG: DNA-directed RNA polymerase subunit beta [Candidatus Delongbacteria bacterium]|nr:DNA-directed RNA polymerase subunit beta [Candidatus Delongbacteria bacterium]
MNKNNDQQRQSFAKIKTVIEMPNLLELQLNSFDKFLQKNARRQKKDNAGLHRVFKNTFPITDTRERYLLEYLDYAVGQPKYSVVECQEIGATYSAPLKVRLRLSKKSEGSEEFDHTIESETYFGTLPIMSPKGTFIINGAERVIVTQLHRSPGVFFSSRVHPNSTTLYSAKVIPFRGSWLEYETTINDSMQVYIDRRKKFPISTFLRAMGFSTNEEIYDLFDLYEKVKINKKSITELVDRTLFEEIIISDVNTSEDKAQPLILATGTKLTFEQLEQLYNSNVKSIVLVKSNDRLKFNLIMNSLKKDSTENQDDALLYIYEQLRLTEAPDIDTAKKHFERMFFDEKRYDLGEVGRYRINQKMDNNLESLIDFLRRNSRKKTIRLKKDEEQYENITIDKLLKTLDKGKPSEKKEVISMLEKTYLEATLVTEYDIVSIIKELLEIKNGKKIVDDIDHLGNRRVKTVGEQLANQFGIALSRMSRTIKERMSLAKPEDEIAVADLINIRTLSSVLNAFFGTNQLSQFMDQVNPLAEITHKRRLSALGAGGLTRDRAGFEVRDVHYTHYGRLCPIETPEGPNIGLISSLATYARVNNMGFIETPYRKVKGGKVTNDVEYLTADEEDRNVIAQANAPLDDKGNFKNPDSILTRYRGDFPIETKNKVNYMDCTPTQVVSAAANLIPFLEHDDANRALMGSNMQRQAVPLLTTDSPYVGTGMESKIAKDSKAMVESDVEGEVLKIDAKGCLVKVTKKEDPKDPDEKYYKFVKFFRTNQDTSINHIPIVHKGDKIKPGDIIADGPATDHGELALGKNVLVAYMSWNGYNFEDAIILSERLVREDVFTSLHIKEYEINVKETKRGEEELTREIPNVSEEATKNLDDEGIIRIGAEVYPGDILVGKVTPKGEVNLTPEDKLLKAIFGEKAGEVKDASLRVPPGDKGIVIETKIFSRKKKDPSKKSKEKDSIKKLKKQYEMDMKAVEEERAKDLYFLLKGKKIVNEVMCLESGSGKKVVVLSPGDKVSIKSFYSLNIEDANISTEWTDDDDLNEKVSDIISNYSLIVDQLNVDFQRDRQKLLYGDELPPGIIQLVKVYIAKKRKIQIGDKMAGRHGNKGIVSRIVPEEDLPYLEDGTPVDIILNPLGVPSRMNPGQIFETNLGWAGKKLGMKYATPVFDGATLTDVKQKLKEAKLPHSGKSVLYDGLTGEKFEQEITVGITYMLKLSHLVEDKLHARSIGPYSLITQQPLGGKAQFGGQRFGEMEVWALEAYGAVHILQEMLTYKSDDVVGRTKVYEAIVKGKEIPKPGIPEAFNVLVKELYGLNLDVTLE